MKQIKIAITGGIGSGKSTVAEVLKNKGCFVIDCDDITKQLYKNDITAKLIAENFGNEFVRDGKTEVKKLASVVFADENKLQKLNAIMHPLIFGELDRQMSTCGKDVVFVQIPLLFETGKQNMFDKIWLVTAKEETRINRVKYRDGLDETQIKNRIKNQMNDEKKAKFAHTIINNDGSLRQLQEVIEECLKNL